MSDGAQTPETRAPVTNSGSDTKAIIRSIIGIGLATLLLMPAGLMIQQNVLCVEGRERLFAFCAEHGVPCERCGKLIVAARADEIEALEALGETRTRQRGDGRRGGRPRLCPPARAVRRGGGGHLVAVDGNRGGRGLRSRPGAGGPRRARWRCCPAPASTRIDDVRRRPDDRHGFPKPAKRPASTRRWSARGSRCYVPPRSTPSRCAATWRARTRRSGTTRAPAPPAATRAWPRRRRRHGSARRRGRRTPGPLPDRCRPDRPW